MILREAHIEDLSNIAELHALSWRENYNEALSKEYLNGEIYSDRIKVWKARFTNPPENQFIFVAEVDNEFCGFVCVFGAKHPKFGSIIDNLHVKSKVKGKGIGTKLLISAAKWAHSNYRNENIYLEVLESNSKAIRFYEHLGGNKIDIAYWHTPCGNKVKEYIYSWGRPEKLAKKPLKHDF